MRPYSSPATWYLRAVTAAGTGLLLFSLRPAPGLATDWRAFLCMTVLGAVAHLYPIRSAQQNARYVVANVFVFAAAVLLGPLPLALHCVAVLLPHTFVNRRHPRIWDGYLFNTAQTLVATMASRGLISLAGGADFGSARGLLVIGLAALLFTVVQGALVGVIIALNKGVPLLKTDTLAPNALMADGVLPFLGAVVAALWVAAPWVLTLLPVPVLVSYKLVRQVHLVQSADIEPKTGLYHYRYFQNALAEELNRSRGGNRQLSVLFADMDYLRDVNNRWGHLAGDEVLKQLAAIIKGQLRQGDLAARFGGEEFVVMLPGTDRHEAAYLAERLRAAVAEHAFAIGGGRTLHCTISIGVACSDDFGRDGTVLVDKADEALYRAKAGGRNRVAAAVGAGMVEVAAAAQPAAPEEAETPGAPTAAAGPKGPAGGPPAPAPKTPRIRAFLSMLVLSCVTVTALLFLALGAQQLAQQPRPLVLVLGVLAIVAELTKIQVYETEGGGQAIAVSLGTAINMAAVGIGGPGAAIVTAFAGALAYQVLSRKRRISLKKRLFNFFNPVLAAGVAAGLFRLVAGERPGASTVHLVAGVVAAVVYYLSNTGVLTLMISLETARPLLKVWRDSIWFAPAFILLGLIGAFVGAAFQVVGFVGALLFIVPIFVLRYTFTLYVRNAKKSIKALQQAKQEVEDAHAAQEQTLRELIEMIAAIIDARDNSTFGHSRQVARYAEAVGRQLGMSEHDLRTLRTAALLHDLGKVGVPESILKKPSRLTDEEYTTIKQHAGLGERILGAVSELGLVARVVGEHHERWDGSGYPQGKQGEAITLAGRIVAVADTLDSILSDRPYSKARPLSAALAELDRCAGSHFDPAVVAAIHVLVEQLGPGAFGNSAAMHGRTHATPAAPS